MIKRNKLGQFVKGHSGYKSWLGRSIPIETRKKIAKTLRGRPIPPEVLKKRSKALKGKPAWNKGLKSSIETRRKMSMARKGRNHWNWQGGISLENERIRKSLEYKLWRESVFKRDRWTCVLCGKAQGWDKKQKKHIDIQADHIKSFSKYPKIRFDVNNGRTMCEDCHIKTETWGNNQYLLR